MTTSCQKCPLRRLEVFTSITDSELSFLDGFKADELAIGAGTQILTEDKTSSQLYTVLEGMAIRFKTLDDGRRQIVNFVMPGDFLGLQSALAGKMGHSVEAMTAMRLCVFQREKFFTVFRDHPARAYDLTWLAASEENFLGEALTTVGQRSAIERIAWGLLSIWTRAAQLDLLNDGSLTFPFRQKDLADTLGLSLVHTNKTLAKLRERDLLSWNGDHLKLLDISALEQLALTKVQDFERQRPLM